MTQPIRFISALVTLFFCSSLMFAAAPKQIAKLTMSGGLVGYESFGHPIAIDGDTIVVGDETASTGTCQAPCQQGAAFVFQKPKGGWHDMTQNAKLYPSDGLEFDTFGHSVAVHGDTIAVGAPCHPHDTTSICKGAVYIFVKPADGWKDMTETAQLLPSDDDNDPIGIDLGWSVAFSENGDTVFAAALGWPLGYAAGAIYVFKRPATGWTNLTQSAELTASDSAGFNVMGASIAVSGNTVAAGSHGWPGGESIGANYIFVEPTTGWTNMTETARITASDGVPGDALGCCVSLQGDTLASGAGGVTQGVYLQGAAYIFKRPATGWSTTSTFTAKITASNAQPRDQMGNVVLSGGGLAVGAPAVGNFKGATYLYQEPTSGWTSTSHFNFELKDPNPTPFGFFGGDIAIQRSLMAVGADLEKPNGAVYLYQLK